MTEKELREAFNQLDRKVTALEFMLFLSATNYRQKRFGFYNLVGIIGVDATTKLIMAYGGSSLKVPKWTDLAFCSNSVGAMIDLLSGMSRDDVVKKWRKHRITGEVVDYLLKTFNEFIGFKNKLDEDTARLADETKDRDT